MPYTPYSTRTCLRCTSCSLLQPSSWTDTYCTSIQLIDSSQGTTMEYEEPSKREELFDPLARFLLLLRPAPPSPSTDTVPMPGALPRTSDRKGKQREVDFDDERLLGFASFRFDTEETLGSSDVEVIYWYGCRNCRDDLCSFQLRASAQGVFAWQRDGQAAHG